MTEKKNIKKNLTKKKEKNILRRKHRREFLTSDYDFFNSNSVIVVNITVKCGAIYRQSMLCPTMLMSEYLLNVISHTNTHTHYVDIYVTRRKVSFGKGNNLNRYGYNNKNDSALWLIYIRRQYN